LLFLFLISSFPFFLTRSNSFFFFSFFFFFFPELEQSSAGLIALLDDPEKKIQEYALKKLNEVIDEFWAEISDAIEKMSVPIAIFFSFSLSRGSFEPQEANLVLNNLICLCLFLSDFVVRSYLRIRSLGPETWLPWSLPRFLSLLPFSLPPSCSIFCRGLPLCECKESRCVTAPLLS